MGSLFGYYTQCKTIPEAVCYFPFSVFHLRRKEERNLPITQAFGSRAPSK